MAGSYVCNCNEGYRGDGWTCQSKFNQNSIFMTHAVTFTGYNEDWVFTNIMIPRGGPIVGADKNIGI